MNADKEIKFAPDTPLLEYKKSYTPDFVQRTLREKNLIGLRIFVHLPDESLASLDFLKDYAFLELLHISIFADLEYSFLNSLANLKDLSISGRGRIRSILAASSTSRL